jgi:hypothetical protein
MPDPPRAQHERRLPRRSSVQFRPEFTLLLVYFFGFFLLFGMLLALPDLIGAARSLPAGSGPLSEEERALAARVAREAVRGRLGYALAAALVAIGIGSWTRALPGLRRRR